MSAIALTLELIEAADISAIGPASSPGATVALIGPRGPMTGERIDSFASASAYAPNFDAHDFIDVSALAEPLAIGAVTGSIPDAARILFRILDDGTARALDWEAGVYVDGGVGLPANTTAGKLMHLGFIYHAGRGTWELVALTVES